MAYKPQEIILAIWHECDGDNEAVYERIKNGEKPSEESLEWAKENVGDYVTLVDTDFPENLTFGVIRKPVFAVKR